MKNEDRRGKNDKELFEKKPLVHYKPADLSYN
jgi:hypothetical protein